MVDPAAVPQSVNLHDALRPHGLAVLGSLVPGPADPVPQGTRALALVGPEGPAFWEVFRASPEYLGGGPDPLDRWSVRVLEGVAQDVGATALFPFGGPPWLPFIDWALRSGQTFTAPVGLLVHARLGLHVSFRGALALPGPCPQTPAGSPCDTCADRPCLAACPPGAMSVGGYDIPGCRAYLDTPQGTACLSGGCQVRSACPVGTGLRPAAQSAFHMNAFHRRSP